MYISEQEIADDEMFTKSSLILLSGDNAHTARALHESLQDRGLNTQFAPDYNEVESLWRSKRNDSPDPVMVLLEVSEQRNVEAAVDTALQLKREDPFQFVGYLADPMVWAGGLIGDAVFPRNPTQLADALANYLNEA